MSTFQQAGARILRFEILLDRNSIERRVRELGKEIAQQYPDKTPVMLGVLKGCVVFLADLVRAMEIPMEIEFVSAASYRQGTKREKGVVLGGASTVPLKGRHVLLVEGIVDTGNTIKAILEEVNRQEPASVEIVTLLDKPASHRSRLDIKYKGFVIGNEFVIGYGLDNTQKYRNLPYIGRVLES